MCVQIHYTVDRVAEEKRAAWEEKSSIGFITTEMCEKVLGKDCDLIGAHSPPTLSPAVLCCLWMLIQARVDSAAVCGPPPMIQYACQPALKALGYGDAPVGTDGGEGSKFFLF